MATALVAGGLSSTAMAQVTTAFPVNKYVQLKNDNKFLVVGEGATRDSLAFQANGNNSCKTLEEFNKTLWKLNVTEVKDEYGLVTAYKLSLENKVYGPVALTYADADASKSLYYAPGAVVSAGEGFVLTDPDDVAYDKEKEEIQFNAAAVEVLFGNGTTGEYDAATKTKIGYKLLKNDAGVIKLLKGSVDVSKKQTAAEINAAEPVFKTTGDDLEFSVEKDDPSEIAMSAKWLNALGNESFKLFFDKDISDNAAFANPFSASVLRAEEIALYSAAVYDVEDYEGALKTVKEAKIAETLGDLDAALGAYAKEVKVALNAEGAQGAITSNAPNSADITAAADEITTAQGVLADAKNKNIADLIKTLKSTVSTYKYGADKKVSDAATKVKKVEDDVKAIQKQVNNVKSDFSNALAKFEAANKAFVAENYRLTGETPAYADFKFKNAAGTEVEPQKELKNVAKLLGSTPQTNVNTLAEATISFTASVERDETDFYPYAVVGQENTYITVDTNYVADKEKYLALTTTKLNKIAVYNSGSNIGKKVDLSKTKFDEASMEYRLVPDLGKWTYPVLFKMETTVNDAELGDHVAITGYGFKAPDTYYREVADDKDNSFAVGKIVIRTLANSREASIMQENEDDAVLENTVISFTAPKLATLVKDGAIYQIINKNAAKEADFDKFRVAILTKATAVSAKEAFLNVPGTQWVASQNGVKYTFANRDFAVPSVGGSKLFVVGENEEDMIYTTGTDTFQLKEINPGKDAHLGYKFISEEVQQISDYVLSAINYANPEVPFFLTFDGNADSTLVAAQDKENAMVLKAMLDKDKKQVTAAYAMNDKNLEKQFYQLFCKHGKDTLYLDVNDNNELIVTKVPTNLLLQFRNVNDEANEYEVLIGEYNALTKTYAAKKKVSYNQKGQAVAVELDEATAFVYDLTDSSTDIYKNFEIKGLTNVIISLDGDEASKVTAVKPFAVVKRTGLELKAAATDNDFVLGLDSAYVDRKDNIRYAYYITKPIDPAKTGSFDMKGYMVSYNDSVVAKRSNDTIKYSQDNLVRIGFVPAQRVEFGNNDSLAIAKPAAVAADTLNIVDKKGVTPATWAFAIESDGVYRIETAADADGNKYVSYLNGILVLGNKEQAQLFNVNNTELTPTGNEEIATAEVTVIAGEGNVTIANAAGKKVVVTNVLGQVVANTVLSSDNATIAAPQGVVVVAVEGEEAIKAIVK